MSTRIKIGFVGTSPLSDRNASSGIPYGSSYGLENWCGDVIELGPFPAQKPPLVRRLAWSLERRLTGKYFRWKSSRECVQRMSALVDAELQQVDCDVIFATRAGWTVALLQDDRPLYVFNDATLPGMIRMGGYSYVDRLTRRSVEQGVELEGTLLRKATAVLMTSEWAAESVLRDYGVSPDKVFVTPNGANLLPEEVPLRSEVAGRRFSGECRLLMVGGSWMRKGGDIAVRTLDELLKLGIDARLFIVGPEPPAGVVNDRLQVVGLLTKNDPSGLQRLTEMYRAADLFLLPTRSESFGTVLAEAAAFGLPSITTDVGGVGQAVIDGVTGVLMPRWSAPSEFAKVIADLQSDEERFAQMVVSARDFYESVLNWDTWGRSVANILKRTLPSRMANRVSPSGLGTKTDPIAQSAR